MVRQKIEAAIVEALKSLGAEGTLFVVERPASMEHGDYATNAALAAAKALKQNPKEVAQKLMSVLSSKLGSREGIEKIEVAGAGFINFFLTREAITKEVERAAQDPSWGNTFLYESKKILVEYTDPNPFKEFHIGHLMTNTIGESIARIAEAAGGRVSRANYQGDVGVHVAKAIWGKMHPPHGGAELSWGEAYTYGNAEYEAHKEETDTLNKIIYDRSDEKVNKLYDEGLAQSLEHFEELYKMLGTKFDYYFFESEVGPVGLEIVKSHPDVFEQSEGATIFRGENVGLHTRVFINSKGLPTYEAKELGLVEAKKAKGNFDLSLTVTANEIRDYFTVVRAAAEKIFPDMQGKMVARFHGFLKLTTGKMSSRLGNVVTGESLLVDLTEAAKEKMQGRELADADKVAEQVAVGAIKYAVLKQTSSKDIIFDPERSLSLEGDSGPYLQYAHTRALSLLRKAQEAHVEPAGGEFLGHGSLERLLVHYPDVVARAARELEPHYVTTYLTELAATFNSWYATERVIVDGKVVNYTLNLVRAVEQTLAKGLHVLGIPAPQEM